MPEGQLQHGFSGHHVAARGSGDGGGARFAEGGCGSGAKGCGDVLAEGPGGICGGGLAAPGVICCGRPRRPRRRDGGSGRERMIPPSLTDQGGRIHGSAGEVVATSATPIAHRVLC
ncbi:hypothetical protein PVAP13_9KG333600 [Panicum virgatum]|uniref:Uncharacterized protein n=1 Tax=Panicum virgatum TaxID=38727 RepID=A0A8T0NRA5_PANVG|nr:hypothetical protein PVAP13_9KG333600 [Panicum virgatum]